MNQQPTLDTVGDGPPHDGGGLFWTAVVVGWALIVFGVVVGLGERDVRPVALAGWVLGGLVLHDVVWLTVVSVVVAGAAALLRRRVPVIVGWAIGTTAVLVVIAWPFARGYGRRADVPSALQRNYAVGLGVYVAAVWLIAGAVVLTSRLRRTRRAGDGR